MSGERATAQRISELDEWADDEATPEDEWAPVSVVTWRAARVALDYVPTPDDLDQLCARISASGYASEAVEIVEEWTRLHWGVESAFTTQWRAERKAEQEARKPVFGRPETGLRP